MKNKINLYGKTLSKSSCRIPFGSVTEMRSPSIFVVYLLAGLGLVGCIPEAGESHFHDQELRQSNEIEQGAEGGQKLGEGRGMPTMDGTWLLGFSNSACIAGGEQVGIAYQLVTITQKGKEIREKREICGYDLSPVLKLKPVIPRAAQETASLIARESGYVTKTAINGGYTSPLIVTMFGLDPTKFTDLLADSLPNKGDTKDPRIVDADKDGQPGSTFTIDGANCSRYTIQRQVTRYMGTFVTPNMVKGKTIDYTETVLLGSNNSLCANDSFLPSPNDRYSEFALARVDGQGGAINIDKNKDGTITCDEAQPYFSTIMPAREPKDENCH